MSTTLILGGVRSGKSRFAQTLAQRTLLPVVYLATATPGDEEMRERIARHRAQRPSSWRTVEEPLELAPALQRIAERHCVVVDCLTLWLTNLLLLEDAVRAESAIEQFCDVLPASPHELVLVSNEVGSGIVPANALARRFSDTAGALHQRLAILCDRVVLMVAGIPQYLRGSADESP